MRSWRPLSLISRKIILSRSAENCRFSACVAGSRSGTRSGTLSPLLIPASEHHRQSQNLLQMPGQRQSQKTNSMAITSSQDVPFAAKPRPLGWDKALAPRGALLLVCSWQSPSCFALGQPLPPCGRTARAVPACPRCRRGLPLDAAIENFLISLCDMSPFPSRLRDCFGRGCPSVNHSGLRGCAPH